MKKSFLISLAALVMAAPALVGGAHAATFDAEYDASILNVVTLGKLTLKGATGPQSYSAAATVQTTGLAALFDDTKLSAQSAGVVAGSAPQFSTYSLNHQYAKPGGKQKSRTVQMQRTAGGVSAVAKPTYSSLGAMPATTAQKNASNDPLTVLVALSAAVGASKGCAGRYLAFDGLYHYAIALSPNTSGTYNGGGYNGKAIVCTIKYEPIAGGKAVTAAERAKIPAGEAWFGEPGASGFAPLLRIEVPTPVGPARLDVKKLQLG